MDIIKSDVWPIKSVVPFNHGALEIDRFEDGSVNMRVVEGHGVGVITDMAFSWPEQFHGLEQAFAGVCPKSPRAKAYAFFIREHHGLDSHLFNSDGQCIYCGEYDEEMDHSNLGDSDEV